VTYARIAAGSGLAVKHGIDIGAGVIDEDYQGEIKVVLINNSSIPFQVQPGDRIAQLIL
jgi:dUTP pyrophosphatase